MLLPEKPSDGKKVLGWAQKITQYIQEISPRSGSGVSVKRTPVGTIFSSRPYYADAYHFEVISDDSYTPSSDERQLAIRGGYFTRAAYGISEYEIEAPVGASPDFLAAGGAAVTDLALGDDQLADQDVWIVYLGLYNSVTADNNPINPDVNTQLYAKAEKGTVGAPPSRPTEPGTSNLQNWCRVLCKVTNLSGKLYFEPDWIGGNIKDFTMIPDGTPLDSTYDPRVEGLNYCNYGDAQDGHLQDRDAHQIIVGGSTVGKYDGDGIISYYDYLDAGVTQKKYARVDGVGGASYRPRNDFDGSAGTTDVMVSITDAGAVTSYGTINYTERVFTVDNAALEIADDTGTAVNVEIIAIDSSIITWDVDLHHDQVDPAASGSPHGDWPSETNDDHELRYWFHADGTGGQDTKNYDTSGEVKADQFELSDDASNYWNHDNFYLDTDTIVDINSADVDIASDTNDINISAATDLDLIGAASVRINASAGYLEIDTNTYVDIEATTYIDIDSLTDIDIDAVDSMQLGVSGGDLTITTSGTIYLAASGDIVYGTGTGETGTLTYDDGHDFVFTLQFEKGGLTGHSINPTTNIPACTWT